MDSVYVLTSLFFDSKGNIKSRNVGVTFSLHEAERHKGQGVENDFEAFLIAANWREDAATTDLVFAMREFRSIVEEWQAAALIEG
ncbi:MAG: hypothetical protein ACLQBK_11960 [Candidatus Sulfotelmatobacter sp.]